MNATQNTTPSHESLRFFVLAINIAILIIVVLLVLILSISTDLLGSGSDLTKQGAIGMLMFTFLLAAALDIAMPYVIIALVMCGVSIVINAIYLRILRPSGVRRMTSIVSLAVSSFLVVAVLYAWFGVR